jgi:DNA-directed RNA polymerase subunit beta'
MKYKGMICDRCGVKVTHSRVRRKRMGHIELAAPVVHIWFFKAMPSRLGNLLGMKTTSLEKVIYFQDYVVIDPGDTPLKEPQQLLTEDEYRRPARSTARASKPTWAPRRSASCCRTLDLASSRESCARS